MLYGYFVMIVWEILDQLVNFLIYQCKNGIQMDYFEMHLESNRANGKSRFVRDIDAICWKVLPAVESDHAYSYITKGGSRNELHVCSIFGVNVNISMCSKRSGTRNETFALWLVSRLFHDRHWFFKLPRGSAGENGISCLHACGCVITFILLK